MLPAMIHFRLFRFAHFAYIAAYFMIFKLRLITSFTASGERDILHFAMMHEWDNGFSAGGGHCGADKMP